LISYSRSEQPFWAKGRSVLFLMHSRAEDKSIIRTLESEASEADFFYLTCVFVTFLILLPSELQIVIIGLQNSSMKFKFIHKIAIIQETFLAL